MADFAEKIIALTGSNGKTTTKELIKLILEKEMCLKNTKKKSELFQLT